MSTQAQCDPFVDRPLVSIVVPVFRVEQYLDDAIAGILSQTYGNLEVVMIDDGSDDGCPAMCDAWAARDARVQVIHQENGGVSRARNAGIQRATGSWILFIDADDLVHPRMVELMCAQLTGENVDIVTAEMITFEGDIPAYSLDGRPETLEGGEAHRRLVKGPNMMACGKLFRRELFSSGLRFFEGVRVGEDVAFTAEAYARASVVVETGLHLYGYRQRTGSAMSEARRALPVDLLKVLDKCISVSADRYGRPSETYDELSVAYVLHAVGKLEHLSLHLAVASRPFLRMYRSFLARHWVDIRNTRLLSIPYKGAMWVSMFSPTSFLLLVAGARFLKRTLLPSLRRRTA